MIWAVKQLICRKDQQRYIKGLTVDAKDMSVTHPGDGANYQQTQQDTAQRKKARLNNYAYT